MHELTEEEAKSIFLLHSQGHIPDSPVFRSKGILGYKLCLDFGPDLDLSSDPFHFPVLKLPWKTVSLSSVEEFSKHFPFIVLMLGL